MALRIASAQDYRREARRRLPPFLFDYIDGAANSEATAQRNIDDLAALSLRQRVLQDVSSLRTTTRLFGRDQALPLALSPVGLSGMYARRGEVQAARAAVAADIPFSLSTVSVCPLREVAAAASPFWFQLYVIRDRGFMRDLLQVAREVGCSALVFTVDMPLPGARYRDLHSGMSGPYAAARRLFQAVTHPRWAWDVGVRGRPHNLGNIAPALGDASGLEDFIGWMGRNFDPSVTWSDLGWIREHWDGPLIIKGIVDPADAREAVALQADGIVVSNHGGRQLDSALATATALPTIADMVQHAVTILVDGGVRSGVDILKMLALGADGVMIGRAWAYALASDGQNGVEHLIAMLAAELRVAMALTGVTDVAHVDRSILA